MMPTAADTPNASASAHQVIAAGTGDSQQHRLQQELHPDVPRPGTDGLSQTDFPRTLANRHQHDVGDADPADEQADAGDRGQYPGQHPEDLAQHPEDLLLGDGAEVRVGVLLM
jgi:hypothetical protein